tara:strand:+ start:2769 stop:3227 length:459 start_codon:yes stop_codon:yes gene_type:complete
MSLWLIWTSVALMRLGVLKEPEGETRVAIVPKSLRKLNKSGFEVIVESKAGVTANHHDSEYTNNGANISDRADVLKSPLIISIHLPDVSELHTGQVVACVADPFRNPEKVQACLDAGVILLSMDMIPRRLSRAQSMDVNSSQDNLQDIRQCS